MTIRDLLPLNESGNDVGRGNLFECGIKKEKLGNYVQLFISKAIHQWKWTNLLLEVNTHFGCQIFYIVIRS